MEVTSTVASAATAAGVQLLKESGGRLPSTVPTGALDIGVVRRAILQRRQENATAEIVRREIHRRFVQIDARLKSDATLDVVDDSMTNINRLFDRLEAHSKGGSAKNVVLLEQMLDWALMTLYEQMKIAVKAL